MIDKNFPLVTIGIPTYNRADRFLRTAVESALTQTYPNIEIIVSDNCSADQTQAVVKSYEDKRISYFRHSENIGANNNFNFCLEQARGDYFLLLQDDDLIDTDMIQACMEAADFKSNIGLIRTGTRRVDEKGALLSESTNQVSGLSLDDFFLGWFAKKTSLYLCSTLFNTRGLKDIGGFRSKHNLFQDVVAEVQLASRLGRVDIKDIKASFRKHHGEYTFAVKVGQWSEDSLYLLDLMCKLASEKRDQVRSRGIRFFSRINYNRASAVRSPAGRFVAYLTVFKDLGYKYPPPIRHFLYIWPFYYPLRSVVHKLKGTGTVK